MNKFLGSINILSDCIKEVLDKYLDSKNEQFTNHPTANFIREDFKETIVDLIDNKYEVKGSAGMGNWAKVPWVGIYDKNIIPNLREGDSVVYLFTENMEGVYLSISQGVTSFKNDYPKDFSDILIGRALNLRKKIKNKFEGEYLKEIQLGDSDRAKNYEKANVIAKYYDIHNLPSDEDLIKDLNDFLLIYEYINEDNQKILVQEWASLFLDSNVLDSNFIEIFKIIYQYKNHSATIDEINRVLSYVNNNTFQDYIISNGKNIKKNLYKTNIYENDEKVFYKWFFIKKVNEGKIEWKLQPYLEIALKEVHGDLETRYYHETVNVNDYFIEYPFFRFLRENGLYFENEIVENFLLSLKIKPFVIFTGNSGTGKTKLAQYFAKYMTKENFNEVKNTNSQYELIPVSANWSETRDLMGYMNVLTGSYYHTKAYDLICHAIDNQQLNAPYFLILDEMNLSHVERYFSDFLSAIESNESIPLIDDTHENGIKIPKNLFIVGTVNIDETTYMFSPKVLDRANIIEFPIISAKRYMNSDFYQDKPQGDIKFLTNPLENGNVKNMKISDLKSFFSNVTVQVNNTKTSFWENMINELNSFQLILDKSNFSFGFRVIDEITRFMAVAWIYEKEENDNFTNFYNWDRYFDSQIKQKILPKIHGSEKSIGITLNQLLRKCLKEEYDNNKDLTTIELNKGNTKYYTSAVKLQQMIKTLSEQRYVSFIN